MTKKRWIATVIIAPILVGFVLLLAEYSIFSKNSDSTESILKKTEEVVKQIDNIEKNEETFVEPDLGNLQTLFEVAGKIYGSTERNAQYVNIIDKSLALKKYALSLKVSEQIYGSTERNKQLKKIIEAGKKER